MTTTPPFAPPYFTASNEAGGQLTETLADGSTRLVPSSERVATVVPAFSNSTTAGKAGGADKGRPARSAGGKDAALVLAVPFADKEKAKKAGARWDASTKKWYVPQGVDIQLFKSWWPADL